MQKKNIIFAIILAVALVSSAVAYRVSGAGLPFGGRVVGAWSCGCSGGWLLRVSPPAGGFFVYNNTPQYAYSQLPRNGVWVLGLYTPGGVCTSGDDCDPVTSAAVQGTITPIVGTSL